MCDNRTKYQYIHDTLSRCFAILQHSFQKVFSVRDENVLSRFVFVTRANYCHPQWDYLLFFSINRSSKVIYIRLKCKWFNTIHRLGTELILFWASKFWMIVHSCYCPVASDERCHWYWRNKLRTSCVLHPKFAESHLSLPRENKP